MNTEHPSNEMETNVQKIQNKYSFIDNMLMNIWNSSVKFNLAIRIALQNIKWKNSKAKPGRAYKPTEIEQLANVITHGVWVLPAMFATRKLFERSKTPGHVLVSCVYGTALTLLFFVSTFFHCSFYCNQKKGLNMILHRCDRAMIYIFIAGSYFPWLQLANTNHSLVLTSMQWIIWILAALGITYQQIFHERFKCLETCFYIAMGVGPALIVIISGHELLGMNELKFGGFLYIVGICFFKSDGVIPMAHAIWHLFVVMAASVHYYAILKNLYLLESNGK